MSRKKAIKFTLWDVVVICIIWVLAGLAAYKAGGYLMELFGRGIIFGGMSFWAFVKVGFFSAVALGCGVFCARIIEPYFKFGLLRRLMLVTLFFSSLIGLIGVVYTVGDFCDFLQLGIFEFGIIPWLIGVCISLWLCYILLKDRLSYMLFGIFFGGRKPDKMPVPKINSFALQMGDGALEQGEYGYAVRCYQTIIERTEKQSDYKWESDTYKEFFDAGNSLAKLYWDGEHIKRDPQTAVKWAERVMKHAASGNKHLLGKYGNVEHSRRIRDSHYEEDMQKLQAEYQEMVDDARWDFKYFAHNAAALAKILYLAYGAGDGAEKNPEKSADYFAKYLAFQQKVAAMDDSPAQAVVTVSGAPRRDEAQPLADFPRLIYDDWQRQWEYDWGNGEEARYVLSTVEDQQTDVKDSLSGGVAYLKLADMAKGNASYLGRTFHW